MLKTFCDCCGNETPVAFAINMQSDQYSEKSWYEMGAL